VLPSVRNKAGEGRRLCLDFREDMSELTELGLGLRGFGILHGDGREGTFEPPEEQHFNGDIDPRGLDTADLHWTQGEA